MSGPTIAGQCDKCGGWASRCNCAALPPVRVQADVLRHPAEYVYGMAPRTDATDKGLANRNAREQYIIMRAHARALEIELREAQNPAVEGRTAKGQEA